MALINNTEFKNKIDIANKLSYCVRFGVQNIKEQIFGAMLTQNFTLKNYRMHIYNLSRGEISNSSSFHIEAFLN